MESRNVNIAFSSSSTNVVSFTTATSTGQQSSIENFTFKPIAVPVFKPDIFLNDRGLFKLYCFIKEFIGASGNSAVAIDNKIEQAMDLVKSHLMIAVREEVEVLKEKISELLDKINELEIENTLLKANIPQEKLQQLQSQGQLQITAGVNASTPALPPAVSTNTTVATLASTTVLPATQATVATVAAINAGAAIAASAAGVTTMNIDNIINENEQQSDNADNVNAAAVAAAATTVPIAAPTNNVTNETQQQQQQAAAGPTNSGPIA